MKLKKILTALLCAATVLGLAGCASSAENSMFRDIADQVSNKSSNTSKNTSKNSSKSPMGSDGVIDWDAVPYADEADFDTETEHEFAYNVEDPFGNGLKMDVVNIIRYNGNEKLIKIPDTIDGMRVRRIDGCGDCVFTGLSDASVKLPKYMVSIYKGFGDCENLTVYTTESAEIWEGENIEHLSVDNNGTGVFLNTKAFVNCENLKLYVAPRSISGLKGPSDEYHTFENCTVSSIDFKGVKYTGDQLQEFADAVEADEWYYE